MPWYMLAKTLYKHGVVRNGFYLSDLEYFITPAFESQKSINIFFNS